MLRLLKYLPKIEYPVMADLPVVQVGISQWEPDSSYHQLQMPPSGCAVCRSDQFEVNQRLSALLMLKFDYGEDGLQYVMHVWVHRACFESCVERMSLILFLGSSWFDRPIFLSGWKN